MSKMVRVSREWRHRSGCNIFSIPAAWICGHGFHGVLVVGALFLTFAFVLGEHVEYGSTVRDFCCEEPLVDLGYLTPELSDLAQSAVPNVGARKQNQLAQLIL